ncbi:MAG: hypothetical protein ABI867_33545, partial [Kofleriaceae bacterium]
MRGILIALAITAVPHVAGAESLLEGLKLEGWYGKVGVESGVAFGRDRGASPLLGGVATLVHINDHLEWAGVQADLLVDWNGDRDAGTRWSVGPEAGVSIWGADVSYFGERLEGDVHNGMQVRGKITVGLAAVYVRGAYAFGGSDAAVLDVGLQLKAPVFIKRPRRGP